MDAKLGPKTDVCKIAQDHYLKLTLLNRYTTGFIWICVEKWNVIIKKEPYRNHVDMPIKMVNSLIQMLS